MLNELKSLGCGQLFLRMLTAIYSSTKMVLKSATIIASQGLKQGAATSVLLFIIYVDRMVKMVKQEVGTDGFLGILHMLLFMDDTVLIATSREQLIKKLKVVQKYCEEYGMSMNMKKTEFLVINGCVEDRTAILSGSLLVKHCDFYIYLGSPITEDGLYSSVIDRHVNEKMKHFIKYCTFVKKNEDFPFNIKKQVSQACLLSAVLYGCDTWLTNDYGKLESLYMSVIKALLGVRTTTCNDVCLIEAGMPTLKALVEKRRASYLQSKIPNLHDDDPLKFAWNLAKSCNTHSTRIIDTSLNLNTNDIFDKATTLIQNRIRSSHSTKRRTFRQLNTTLDSPKLYCGQVPEYKRIAFTRFRLSSHRLRVETGRWLRIPREERLCNCGSVSVQDEKHVLLVCEMSQDIRDKYDITHQDLQSFFSDETVDDADKVSIIYEILKKFDN